MTSADVIAEHERRGRYFEAGGVKSFVREQGAGEAIVMLHGVPASSFTYRKMLPLLAADGYRAIAFDLPGLGLAEHPRAFDYSTSNLVRFTAAAIDALGIDQCHLVVHDFGGPIGCEWAVRHPDRVLSLTVLNTTLNLSTYRDPWTLQLLRVRGINHVWNALLTRRLFVYFLYRDAIGNPAALKRAEAEAYYDLMRGSDRGRGHLRITADFELTAEKERLICNGLKRRPYPTQIIWGADDPVLRDEHRRFVEGVLGLSSTLLPASHFLQEDQAEALSAAVVRVAGSVR